MAAAKAARSPLGAASEVSAAGSAGVAAGGDFGGAAAGGIGLGGGEFLLQDGERLGRGVGIGGIEGEAVAVGGGEEVGGGVLEALGQGEQGHVAALDGGGFLPDAAEVMEGEEAEGAEQEEDGGEADEDLGLKPDPGKGEAQEKPGPEAGGGSGFLKGGDSRRGMIHAAISA